MTTPPKNPSSAKAVFMPGPIDIMAMVGVALIAVGIALVNIPLALFTAGVLIYTPAVIAELR